MMMTNKIMWWWAVLFGLAASKKTCEEAVNSYKLPKFGPRDWTLDDLRTGITLQMRARADRLRNAGDPIESEHCPEKLGNRSHCEDCQESRITVLWSFPGSGNTFTRTLIEASTLIYTGSIYTDIKIAQQLPAEMDDVTEAESSSRLSAIKLHSSPWHQCGSFMMAICDYNVRRAIMLVRHPLSAAWAEFQREVGGSSHTAALDIFPSTSVNESVWFAKWETSSQGLFRQWDKMIQEQYARYASVYGDASYTILRFEDLVNPLFREVELKHALDFAGLSNYYTDQSIACAFDSELSEAFHRKRSTNSRRASRRLTDRDIEARDEASSSAKIVWMALDDNQRNTRWAIVRNFATMLGYLRVDSEHSM